MTYRELYEYGKSRLSEAGIAEAGLDARLLLEYVCHADRNELILYADRERNSMEEQFYRMVIEKRASRIPLQHITGEQEFMGLSFQVNEHVLIPRQDTEILVEEAMRHLGDGMRILDLCTGSGCILLSLLKYSNECEGVGIDISEEALKTARENAEKLGLDAVFLAGDLFGPLADFVSERTPDRLFDMVVSNPPYFPVGSGTSGGPARSEACCTLEELCAAASRLVKNGGRFALCHRPERLADVICALRGHRLEPKRLKLVSHSPAHPPSLLLVEAVRQGRPGLTIEA